MRLNKMFQLPHQPRCWNKKLGDEKWKKTDKFTNFNYFDILLSPNNPGPFLAKKF